jgi:hypothetical protein
MKRTSIVIACLLALGISGSALADSTSEVDALKQHMTAMQSQMQQMQEKINALTATQEQVQAQAKGMARQYCRRAPIPADRYRVRPCQRFPQAFSMRFNTAAFIV